MTKVKLWEDEGGIGGQDGDWMEDGGRKAFGPETPILALSQRLTRVR